MKTCPSCNQQKPLTEFYVTNRNQPSSMCKACIRIQQHQWALDNKTRKYEINEQWRQRNKSRMRLLSRSSQTVFRAIKSGILIRPTQCSNCGATCVPEASHDDYTKLLEVVWLCRSCHRSKDSGKPKTIPHDQNTVLV